MNSENNNTKVSASASANPQEPNVTFKVFLEKIFNLNYDKENDFRTIETIKADVDFRGTKLWILICAIMIASLGLNVNSTAVIIGAMLISPLMGPIIGFGLGLGISDFELIKRSLRNLALTTLFSILTATIYFLLSPLSKAQSELLARTQPTIYDVLIAFVGGIAGILASSTKTKGNVIPGVAIATALMPPLCTAGYGLAQLNMQFFFGAFYLYIINSVFIALATFLMVRALKFPRKAMVDKAREQRIRKLVAIIAICTIVPSIYLGFKLIKDSVIEDGAHRFVKENLNLAGTQVIKDQLVTEKGAYKLEVILLGQTLTKPYIDSITALMPKYGLKDIPLVIKQGLESQTDYDVSELKSVLLQDLYNNSDKIIKDQQQKIDSLQNLLNVYGQYNRMIPDINSEAKVVFPEVKKITFAPTPALALGQDSVLLVIVKKEKNISNKDQARLNEWLKNRTKTKYVNIIYDNSK